MNAAQAILDNVRTDVCVLEANLIRAESCRPVLAVALKQICLDASRNARRELEKLERQLEDELVNRPRRDSYAAAA